MQAYSSNTRNSYMNGIEKYAMKAPKEIISERWKIKLFVNTSAGNPQRICRAPRVNDNDLRRKKNCKYE